MRQEKKSLLLGINKATNKTTKDAPGSESRGVRPNTRSKRQARTSWAVLRFATAERKPMKSKVIRLILVLALGILPGCPKETVCYCCTNADGENICGDGNPQACVKSENCSDCGGGCASGVTGIGIDISEIPLTAVTDYVAGRAVAFDLDGLSVREIPVSDLPAPDDYKRMLERQSMRAFAVKLGNGMETHVAVKLVLDSSRFARVTSWAPGANGDTFEAQASLQVYHALENFGMHVHDMPAEAPEAAAVH